ncbi:hypothetical protein [Chloroflexus sp.]|uniref:hypothetical protein n=1 Tax=Chloroflexus sp. TaxID=1904827 RepID=UPI00260F99D7|nr:hypothetical protein [uncultured Chloroflexus sp.]
MNPLEHFLASIDPHLRPVVVEVAKQLPRLPRHLLNIARHIHYSPSVIASRLHLSEPTVRKYIDMLYSKLNLKDHPAVQNFNRATIIVLAIVYWQLKSSL